MGVNCAVMWQGRGKDFLVSVAVHVHLKAKKGHASNCVRWIKCSLYVNVCIKLPTRSSAIA